MSGVSFKYPLLNELSLLEGESTHVVNFSNSSLFTITPEHGDTLTNMQFSIAKNKVVKPSDPVTITLTQGDIQYQYITSKFNIPFDGLGLPSGMGKDPLMVHFSQPVVLITFTLTKLNEETHAALCIGCRYQTQKKLWTVVDGKTFWSAPSDVCNLAVNNEFSEVSTDKVYTAISGKEIQRLCKLTVPFPSYAAHDKIHIYIPQDKIQEMSNWLRMHKCLEELNWIPIVKRGKLIKSRLDEMMQISNIMNNFVKSHQTVSNRDIVVKQLR